MSELQAYVCSPYANSTEVGEDIVPYNTCSVRERGTDLEKNKYREKKEKLLQKTRADSEG